MTQFLCCPPETVTALSINYTPIQNKKLKKNEAAAFLIALCSPGEMAAKLLFKDIFVSLPSPLSDSFYFFVKLLILYCSIAD